MATQISTQENDKLNKPPKPVPTPKPVARPTVPAPSPGSVTPGTINAARDFSKAQNSYKMQAFQSAEQKATPSQNYAAEMLPEMQQPRTVERVDNVIDLNAGRERKASGTQYAGDDVNQMARVYTATPGYREDVDYSTLIRELSLQPATKENQAIMRNLLSARRAKVSANGDLAQYADDEISALGQNYLNKYVPYTPEEMDTDVIYDRADDLARKNYDETVASLNAQKRLQMQNQMRTYAAQRRAADLAYAKNSRGMENVLAEQGIGRGLGAGPSSGYSESARLGALANYSNDINESYQQQAAAERELAAQFEAQRMQAMGERNAALRENYGARVDQMNADREFARQVHAENADYALRGREFDASSKLTDAQVKNLDADTKTTDALLDANVQKAYADVDQTKTQTEAQKITNLYLPDSLQFANDAARSEAALKNEQAINAWLENLYAGDKYRAEATKAKIESMLLAKEYTWYDVMAAADAWAKRNGSGGGSGGGGGRKASSKSDKSGSGSGGSETYGDSVLADIEALLEEDGADADVTSVLGLAAQGGVNDELAFVSGGKVNQVHSDNEQSPFSAIKWGQ